MFRDNIVSPSTARIDSLNFGASPSSFSVYRLKWEQQYRSFRQFLLKRQIMFPSMVARHLSSIPHYLDLSHFDDPLYLLIPVYIVTQPLLRYFLSHQYDVYSQHKQGCKYLMAGYNLGMTIFSFFVALTMIYALTFEVPNGVFGPGHYRSSLYQQAGYAFYLSKYIEFVDTYFLILCGRPVSWLQYLHHIGAVLDMGILYNWQSELTWVFVAFNGLIHTVMYAYYAAAIMKWPFPCKQAITALQLLQFALGLATITPYSFQEWFWKNDSKRSGWVFTYGYVVMLIVLFVNFWRMSYGGKKKKAA